MVNLAMRRTALAVSLALMLVVTGCLYPRDHTPGNNVSVHGSVMAVQDAVKRYQGLTGVLPIQNADESVPLYEKYKIDFGKLQRSGFIENLPKHAYESGGSYQFLIVHEETDPQVKLLDIKVFQTIADVQRRVTTYLNQRGEVPGGTEAYPGFVYLDFEKLGMDRPDLRSMYSSRPLELMVDRSGKVHADYAIDIAEAMQKIETVPDDAEDLREWLVSASDYVPVKSPVYRMVNGNLSAVAESAESISR